MSTRSFDRPRNVDNYTSKTIDTKDGEIPKKIHSRYFPEIDGLRAVAVISVIAFHLNAEFAPAGFTGVDAFFVISGFVVTHSMFALERRTFAQFVMQFYARRIARILPALCLTIVVTALAFCLFIPNAWLSGHINWTGFAAIFGFSNLILPRSADYFSPQANFNPFTQTWSLGVEEQFYLVIPILIFLLTVSRHIVLAMIAALIVTSFVLGAYQTATSPLIAFYWMPARFWELGVGVLLRLSMDRWNIWLERRPYAPLIAALLGCATIILGIFVPLPVSFPVPGVIPTVAGTTALIIAVIAAPSLRIAAWLRSTPAAAIGKISFSLYLWHWPVVVLFKWTVGLEGPVSYLLAIIVSLCLSVATFYYVENPVRRFQRQLAHPRLVLLGGAVTLMATAVVVGLMFSFKNKISLSVTRDVAQWYSEGTRLTFQSPNCRVTEKRQAAGSLSMTVLTPENCAQTLDRGRLFVSGDSHAAMYDRLLRRFAAESGREVAYLFVPGCGLMTLLSTPQSTHCIDFERRAAENLGSITVSEDVIFLPSLRLERFSDQWTGSLDRVVAKIDEPSQKKMSPDTLIEILQRGGSRVVLEGPPPLFRAPPFRCADTFNRANPICKPGFMISRLEIETIRDPVISEFRRIIENFSRVSIWDPFPILCPGLNCNAFQGTKPLFFDQDHLSDHGNDVLFSEFKMFFDSEFARR